MLADLSVDDRCRGSDAGPRTMIVVQDGHGLPHQVNWRLNGLVSIQVSMRAITEAGGKGQGVGQGKGPGSVARRREAGKRGACFTRPAVAFRW